jgi:hypothetical protein
MRVRLAILGLMSAGFLSLNINAVSAAGTYDGNWVLDFPASGYSSAKGDYACPGIRLPLTISNNQVSGRLGRTAAGTGYGFQGSSGQPVSGAVQQDGTLNLSWEKFTASGKLSGTQGHVSMRGSCGQRSGTVVRLQQ